MHAVPNVIKRKVKQRDKSCAKIQPILGANV